ncbi:PAC2 family protein [Anaerohalosphaera lusitana]|uniref:PAC2 family protein n=1 Tax=Anaerohalosphaera lusitana TaxID=1936003 RepID=A0A1U9NMY0_9BACT|nr:PAC2 family protein [Anaerohalosphaera lusitana]AQT68960.1 PAC2 family protein [Anaerohalosphaera lusitana]
MSAQMLNILEKPNMKNPTLLLGFSGWMNGGEVSTGTVQWLIEDSRAREIAEINPEGFYIYNFPGTMETTTLFRPHTRIVDGVVAEYQTPENVFYYDDSKDLVLFSGKEPNLNWEGFADCIFEFCEVFGIEQIVFIGSVAGLVPHTRDPSMFFSVSDENLRSELKDQGFSMSEYEGPASFTTYLAAECPARNKKMVNVVAAVPAYVQGENPKCIEAVLRNLTRVMDVKINLHDLRFLSDEFEKRLTEAVKEVPELSENIGKLEQMYDKEIIDHEMGDLKRWLENRGVSLD